MPGSYDSALEKEGNFLLLVYVLRIGAVCQRLRTPRHERHMYPAFYLDIWIRLCGPLLPVLIRTVPILKRRVLLKPSLRPKERLPKLYCNRVTKFNLDSAV